MEIVATSGYRKFPIVEICGALLHGRSQTFGELVEWERLPGTAVGATGNLPGLPN